MSYLEAKDIKKKYKDFDLECSLSVEKGELVCLLGPSGSGKSTLLSLLSGIETPESGSVLLDGENITSLPVGKRGIGFVFQDYALFNSMNTEKNIQYGMKTKKRDERKELTKRLLEIVGLEGYEKRKVETLSGGEAQRVALVRALAAEPQILFLDEPLSSLDAPLRKKLRGTIRSLHDRLGVTMLYVTHDREEAFAIADRIIIMKDGHIESTGTPEEVYRHPGTLFSAYFTGDGTSLPASLLYGVGAAGTLFFRPEAVTISEEPLNTGIYPNHVIFNECIVESIEYKGEGYMIGLNFRGNPLIAFSPLKPKKREISIMLLRDSLIKL